VPERRSLVAALLDRDGTIVVDCEYTSNPDQVRLLPGAAAAITRLSAAGYPSIVVTNQSGIARGIITASQYHAVRRRLDDLLREEGAELCDTFTCPHHPDFNGPCDCRKPETGLYERAAAMYELDLSRCFFIGDRIRDIAPAQKFNARAALVRSPITSDEDVEFATKASVPVVNSLSEAVDVLLTSVR
jgi:histidinol-phosphate phosphatase family protein